ncbi:MAG: hypothetical protein GY705_06680 [Bacteroidetes bacterium]|nr:hypothetical protein [Bacteroidota bacterium]
MKTCTHFLRLQLLALLFVLASLSSSHLRAQCDPASDSLALVALYNATNGDEWEDNTNWLVEGQAIGSWHGVYVNLNGCVERLDLSFNNLKGELPPEIGNLSNLTKLSLNYNQLTGNIPPEIGNLVNLEYLDLSSNDLTGNIPSEIGNLSNLKELYLLYNHLTGNIPSEIGNLRADPIL